MLREYILYISVLSRMANVSFVDSTAFDELADRNLIEPTDETCLFYRVVGTGNGYALPKDT